MTTGPRGPVSVLLYPKDQVVAKHHDDERVIVTEVFVEVSEGSTRDLCCTPGQFGLMRQGFSAGHRYCTLQFSWRNDDARSRSVFNTLDTWIVGSRAQTW